MTTTYGTLSITPGFPAGCEIVRRGASSPASSGFVVSRQFQTAVSRNSGEAKTRTWTLNFKTMSSVERDSLLASFDSALAGALPILVTPPPPDDGSAIPVRMTDAITIEYDRSAQVYRARVDVEEVI